MKSQTQPKCHGEAAVKEPSFIKSLWENYKLLIIILAFCLILPLVQNDFTDHIFMYSFMGYFFIFLSLFKFFNLKGFVEGFATYDIVTKRFQVYGYTYPFIEFFLGLAYLSKYELYFVNWVTFAVMTVSGFGVMLSILSGQKVKCACLGTVLNVPLSTVSVLENFGMGSMAFLMAFSANS